MKLRPSFKFLLSTSLIVGVLAFTGTAHPQGATTPGRPAPAQPPKAAPTPPKQPHLPPFNPATFTATSPTKAEVQSFLKVSWGYDPNRIWEIAAILKTTAPGVSKVVVFVAEKNHPRVGNVEFFVTPDGKHLIAGNSIVPFGPDPFQAAREVLQKEANGPWAGSSSRTHQIVEFADFECPHCKAAQPVIAKLRKDFPNIRYVFQYFPLVSIHPEAFKAAVYGSCVAKAGGNADFFKYADNVFENQAGLTPTAGNTTLDDAVKAAGLDPVKIAACANSPAGKAAVEASMNLGKSLHVDETPTLYIDGRPVPMMEVPYSLLKQIIQYQISLDSAAPAAR